jgi:acyl-coenzyme A synthetase/AMP-(fatty) acid ligase
VPVNFRLVAPEVKYILDFGDCRAVITEREFAPVIDEIRDDLPEIDPGRYVCVGGGEGYRDYEELLTSAPAGVVPVEVVPEDTWIMLFTSGTTGRPKGVVRSHESYTAFYLVNGVDFRFHGDEVCMNVMPLCHVNSGARCTSTRPGRSGRSRCSRSSRRSGSRSSPWCPRTTRSCSACPSRSGPGST